MKEFTFTVADPQGIHARPAGLLVKEAQKYESSIIITKGAKTGDAKKIFAVMALGVKQGETITVAVDGTDETTAAEAMEAFFKENF